MDEDAQMTYEDPAANAPDAAALDRGKGKGKAVDYPEAQNKDEDTSDDESEADDLGPEALEEEEEDGQDSLEDISTTNIIPSGRRTRGKQIDFVAAAEKDNNFLEDDEDDDDFKATAEDEEMQGWPSKSFCCSDRPTIQEAIFMW